MKFSDVARAITRKLESEWARRSLMRHVDETGLIHERLGTEYGGWHVPVGMLNEHSLCYCVGAGEDVSFEIELINRYGCEVYSFDPTPRARQHIDMLADNTNRNIRTRINNSEGSFYRTDARSLSRWHFHPFGIWKENRKMRFYAPADHTHVSHSIVNLQQTDRFFEAECRTVKYLMELFGHERLTLLKLDIEGAEGEVLASVIEDQVRPTILCVEFDEGHHRRSRACHDRIPQAIALLKRAGYVMSNLDLWNATFVHERSSSWPRRPGAVSRGTGDPTSMEGT
jgi:FkbM family methyltransferase